MAYFGSPGPLPRPKARDQQDVVVRETIFIGYRLHLRWR